MNNREKQFLFTSERLGFRNWQASDLDQLHKINSDPVVMKYFPSIYTSDETQKFIERMQRQFSDTNYCYFATELLDNEELIGFIGLQDVDIEGIAKGTDIGWRLSTTYQGLGLATEGAKRCVEYGLKEIGLEKIISIAPKANTPSINVMKKIGMSFVKEFNHPKLIDSELNPCVLYRT